jgi:serine phosphatase RsbU (regulator of sigma subunit)
MYIDPASLSWFKNLLEVKLITIENMRKKFVLISLLFGLFFLSYCKEPVVLGDSIFTEKREFLWVNKNQNFAHPKNLSPSAWSLFQEDQLGLTPIKDHDLWIRFPEPKLGAYKNPVLFIEIALENLLVFQGTELIYAFEKTDYVFPHIIPLKNQGDHYIYIRCRSAYKSFIGLDRTVKYLEHSDALVGLFSENVFRSFLTPVLLFLSFLFFGIYFLRRKTIINFYFSLLLFSSSLIEGLNGFIGYSFQDSSSFVSSIQYINYIICPVLLLLFLGEVFPPLFKKIFKLFIIMHLLIYIYYVMKNWDHGVSYLNAEWDFAWWMILESISIILTSVYVFLRGQLKLGLITFGLLAMVIAGAHDIFVDMEILPYKFQVMHFGFWLGIISFSFFVFKYYLDMIKSLDAFNEQLINKNKELERLVAIDKDLILAKELQKSLLSDLEKGDGHLNIVSFNHSLHSIGGDYFDYVNDSMGNWGVLICDVAGHGISSAVVAAMSKMAFTATSPYIQYPAKVFNSMNRNLYGKNRGMFITASYLYIDTESKVLSYVNAGHPNFYLLRKSSPYLLDFKTKGRPLGIFPDSEYSVGILSLERGDRLFLFTDGIPDLNNSTNEAFGEERLRQMLWENRTESFESFHKIMQRELYTYSKSWEYQDDDVSYIMIEIK